MTAPATTGGQCDRLPALRGVAGRVTPAEREAWALQSACRFPQDWYYARAFQGMAAESLGGVFDLQSRQDWEQHRGCGLSSWQATCRGLVKLGLFETRLIVEGICRWRVYRLALVALPCVSRETSMGVDR